MDILLISNEDACRSRIAQELLHTFGRGMNISTAGVMEGNCVPDVVCNVMEQNGYGISRKSLPVSEHMRIGHGTMLLPCVKKLRKN